MTGTLRKLALASTLALLAIPPATFAGRGGGYRGGGGYGGGSRGGGGYSGRGQMGHSPSFSQPSSYGNHSQSGNTASSANRNPYATNSNAGAAAAGADHANKNQSPSNAGAAAAGAGYANKNQSPSNAGAAAAGAGYANKNQSPSNAGAAAAGADYANKNQGIDHPAAGGAAAGAGYANRNNQDLDHPGAAGAAAGAGYANHNNQGLNYPGAAGAAAGAGYANHNQYDQYHPGMGYGNYGNYGYAGGMGGYGGYGGYGYGSGVGAWGMGSPMYGWGYSNYNNAYAGLGPIGGGGNQPPVRTGPPPFDYSQPISTTASAPSAPVASTATAGFDQARDAFKQGNYALAVQLGEQALGQMPNDPNIHQFVALGLFAQGQYDQAAAPLYAVLTIGPGWNWTTLMSAYAEADAYTQQIRALEAYVRANPQSAPAHFVLGYHYLTQGHNDAAAKQFEHAAGLQPSDKLSAQLAAQLQPPASQPTSSDGVAPATTTAAADAAPQGKLAGRWAATPAKDARVALAINDDGNFTWAVTTPGQPDKTIAGKSTFANGVLTLAGQDKQLGALAGQVAWQDDNHMTFRVLGAPQDDPGLKFER